MLVILIIVILCSLKNIQITKDWEFFLGYLRIFLLRFMNFIIFHSEKNFIISGVCIFRSLSCQEFVMAPSCPSSVLVNMIYCSVKYRCSNSSIPGVILHSIYKIEVWVRGLYNSWVFCVHKRSMFIYLSMFTADKFPTSYWTVYSSKLWFSGLIRKFKCII